jgi:hypothetical protein
MQADWAKKLAAREAGLTFEMLPAINTGEFDVCLHRLNFHFLPIHAQLGRKFSHKVAASAVGWIACSPLQWATSSGRPCLYPSMQSAMRFI